MDVRLKRYAAGAEDRDLEALYFQFGRYLLISGSRTKAVPMNLQGIWNPYMRPPWSSNYTVNINVETNYWLAENTNLSELHAPLLEWTENVSKTGAVTAKTFLGMEGWMACHNSDIWAMSNPVGDFGKGHPVWANWYLGGAWLSTHLWEHYSFSQDKEYLKEAFPLIKGAAQFCLNWLVEGENGYLMTSPGSSPENRFYTTEGYVGSTLYGATSDLAIIRELFEQTIAACNVLKIEHDFKERLLKAHARLQPYKIGSKGNLQNGSMIGRMLTPNTGTKPIYLVYTQDTILPQRTKRLLRPPKKPWNSGDQKAWDGPTVGEFVYGQDYWMGKTPIPYSEVCSTMCPQQGQNPITPVREAHTPIFLVPHHHCRLMVILAVPPVLPKCCSNPGKMG